jgi:hypothetical protein
MTNEAAIEQAFALARSGQYRSISEIIRRLPADARPAVDEYLSRPGARRDLILVCGDAWLANN